MRAAEFTKSLTERRERWHERMTLLQRRLRLDVRDEAELMHLVAEYAELTQAPLLATLERAAGYGFASVPIFTKETK